MGKMVASTTLSQYSTCHKLVLSIHDHRAIALISYGAHAGVVLIVLYDVLMISSIASSLVKFCPGKASSSPSRNFLSAGVFQNLRARL